MRSRDQINKEIRQSLLEDKNPSDVHITDLKLIELLLDIRDLLNKNHE